MDIFSVLCIYCFLFSTTAVGVQSIKCYECSSQINPSSCGKDFKLKSSDTNYIIDKCDRCLYRITRNERNVTEYSRECSAADVDGCITTSPQEEQCFCQTDLCNRWSPLTAPADLYNKSSSMTAAIATVIINTLLFSTFK
ncbi:uncharacterized protein LOC143058637 [Mytilus galloprovincialis]|uniref:uncharacterized protein LOC143058637 n=1 Tax=Mytilus galloprovincialis TaxID=29158 RepID=UPI003F7C20C5